MFKIPLFKGAEALPPLDWEKKQSKNSSFESIAICGENNNNSPSQCVKQKIEIKQLISSENPYRRKLSQFPSLLEPANYQNKPAHNVILDVEPIDSEGNIPPFRVYKKTLNAGERKIVREKLTEWVERGILVKQSAGSYTSPISLVPKKNGETRLCVNYRNFNSRTRDLYYPLPSPFSLIETLSNRHKVFSSLDLKDAYFSLPLSQRTSELCGIMVDGVGSFKPRVAMFGMKQAPAKFQELASLVIEGLENNTFVYLDDFLVFSESEQEHLEKLFSRLQLFGLHVNEKKCVLGANELDFLGFHISADGVTPLVDKVEALKKLSSPTTIKELRSFLGAINFYRKFLPNLAEIQEPLYDRLKGKNIRSRAKITLTIEQEQARQSAIRALIDATQLQYEDTTLPLVITSDASKSHCGAVLEQFESDSLNSNLRPLAFFSSKLSAQAKVRTVFNAELTGLYKALVYFRVRVRNRPLIIRTDHSALVNAIRNITGKHSPRQ